MKPPVMLATVYRRAAKVIRERGWYQGGFMPDGDDKETCPVCAWGALNVVICGEPIPNDLSPTTDARRLVEAVIGRPSLASWNDAKCRTKAQVLAALKRAERKAAREKARVQP